MNPELLQEAERRGLLSPEKQALLDEVRRRGLLEAQLPQAPGGVSVNPEAVDEFRSKGTAAIDGIIQGGTFGFADEIAGARAAALGMNRQPDGAVSMFDYSTPMGERYTQERDAMRDMAAQSQEQEPTAYGGGQIAGAIGPALASAPAAIGKSALGTVLRGMGIGGAEGALHGAGAGETMQERAKGALDGGIVGGIVGGAAPMVVGAAGAGVRGLVGGADAVFNRANQTKAMRAIATALRESGDSADNVTRAVQNARLEGQPEFRLMDALGVAGQRKASGIARTGGESGAEIADYLSQRQAGQGDRVSSFVDDAFGMNGGSAAKAEEAMRAARKAEADIAYSAAAANARPVDVQGVIVALDDTISKMTNSGIKPPKVVKQYKKLRDQLAGQAPDGSPTTLSDYESVLGIWRETRDSVDKAYRAGDGAVGEALKPIRDGLEQALSDSSDMFRQATAQYRDASKVIDAVDAGKSMVPGQRRSIDTISEFQGMTPEQQAAARVGYGDRILAQLNNQAAPTSNKAKLKPKTKEEFDAMTVDPELLGRRLQRENDMWETQNRALGGSRTADNQEDVKALQAASSGIGGAVRKAANFQFGDAAMDLNATLGSLARGETDKTRSLIAKALMSDDPASVLNNVLNREQRGKLLDALLAASMRPGGSDEAAGPFITGQ